MQTELFAELENKLEALIEEVETLRLEVSELRSERDSLKADKQASDNGLQRLLGKFERLQESADL